MHLIHFMGADAVELPNLFLFNIKVFLFCWQPSSPAIHCGQPIPFTSADLPLRCGVGHPVFKKTTVSRDDYCHFVLPLNGTLSSCSCCCVFTVRPQPLFVHVQPVTHVHFLKAGDNFFSSCSLMLILVGNAEHKMHHALTGSQWVNEYLQCNQYFVIAFFSPRSAKLLSDLAIRWKCMLK